MAAYYEIIVEDDETDSGEKCFLVAVPAFPEVTTYGYTLDEAMENAGLAIEESIAARMAHGENIPHPLQTLHKGKHYAEVPILILLKCSLYVLCREKGTTRAQLARDLGWHREQVDRLFRLDHNSRIDQLDAAFRAVKSPLTMSMPDHEIMVV